MNALLVTALGLLASVARAAPSGHGVEAVVEGPSGIVTDLGPTGPAEQCLVYANGATLIQPHSADLPEVVVEPTIGLGDAAAAFTAGGGSTVASYQGATIKGPRTVPVLIIGPSGKIYAEGLWGPTANIGANGVYGAAGHIGLGRGYAW